LWRRAAAGLQARRARRARCAARTRAPCMLHRRAVVAHIFTQCSLQGLPETLSTPDWRILSVSVKRKRAELLCVSCAMWQAQAPANLPRLPREPRCARRTAAAARAFHAWAAAARPPADGGARAALERAAAEAAAEAEGLEAEVTHLARCWCARSTVAPEGGSL